MQRGLKQIKWPALGIFILILCILGCRPFPGHKRNSQESECNGGAEEDQTPDLCIANVSLSQLSYSPKVLVFLKS